MISKLSNVHPDAKIGENVTVESFSTIQSDVVIGEGTWIGPNVTVFNGARIGKNCKIFPGAVIGAIPQDLKYQGENTTAEIGDNCTIREMVTINKGTLALGKTQIGNNCLLMAYVHVAHDCLIGDNVILANSVNLAGHVIIENFAILEGYVGVSQFIRIGAHSFIAGQTGVRKDVPPFTKAAREPLSFAGINSVGLKRRGYDSKSVNLIQDVYRILYTKGYSTRNALDIIEKEIPSSPHKDEIIDFIKSSERGIMRGYSGGDDE
ncbi:MAG TPA: acyl-ACP--UDP-N-acetylglucosamine O-acyltransferase [Bacteroidia bacterium]|nr:acyl-ACP--UDP-N-acetylglucosamine O-acyltransferase [Bacteroidia bacterium]